MFTIAVFCIPFFLIQFVYGQTIVTVPSAANPLPGKTPAFTAVVGPGTPGTPILANGIPAAGFNPVQALGMTNQIGGPVGINPNQIANQIGGPIGMNPNQIANQLGLTAGINNPYGSYGPNFGGSGSGDVVVVGELPVVGNTMVTGHIPLSGKVKFGGSIPAGGIVTISGQCLGPNNGQANGPPPTKNGFNNNKQFVY